MTNDFIISRAHGSWRIVATSDRGKVFAAGDERFADGRADLGPAEALGIYDELFGRSYYPSVPDGLPPLGRIALYARVATLIALLIIPFILVDLIS